MSGRDLAGVPIFLQGGGEAGDLIRARDWSSTPLGAAFDWPRTLQTLVGIMLGSRQPMLIVWGAARTVLYNDSYAEICGDRHPAALGGPFEALWHDVWEEVEPIITRGFAGESVHMDDIGLVVNRRGIAEEAHFAFGYTPVRGESGAVAGLFCACTETTSQVRAAAAVREREERLRLVVEGARDYAIVTTNAAGIVTSWSSGAEAIFGWSAVEAIGRPCGIIFVPIDVAEGLDDHLLQRAARHGVVYDERWHLRKDGSRVYMNGSVRPLSPDAQGRPQGFLKVARDETERRRNADALRQARDRAHEILDGMDEGFIVLDADFRVVEINRAGLRIDGRAREQIIGRSHAELYPKTVGTPVEYTYRSAMRNRAPAELVHRYVDETTGHDLWLELRVFPTESGGVAGFYRDITRRKRAEERLIVSEESLRLTAEAAEIGTWDLDLQSDSLTWSRRTREMFGIFSDRRCTMADFYGGLHRDDLEATSAALAAALDPALRSSYDVVYRTVGKEDGIVRWVAAKGKGIFDDTGRCVRILGTANDVTERRVAERRETFLLELSDRLRAEDDPRILMQIAVDMLGRELGASRVGYGLIEINGQRVSLETEYLDGVRSVAGIYPLDAFGPGNIANLRAGRTSVFADTASDLGTPGLGRYAIAALVAVPLIRDRRLSAVLYVNHDQPRTWRGAEIALVEEVATRIWDAVERARAQDALREINETLEQQVAERTRERDQIWQATSDLLCVASFDGYFLSLNPAWPAVLGWSEAELKAVPFLDFVHPDDREMTIAAAGGLSRGEAALAFENRYRTKDGAYRWFSWNAVPLEGLVYATVRDITAVKAQAEVLAQTEEALRQSQKMEAVGQLTGGLAHDFNNLLTGIAGSLELLEIRVGQGRLNDVSRYVQAAQGAAKRAAALTHRLLAFSRRQTLDPKPTDVNRLIVGIEDLIRRTVGPSIEIEVIGAAGIWLALVDPNQLENALLNLCLNARDAMPDGGRITIETANKWLDGYAARERELEPGQYLSLCVTDTGTGMTRDVIAKAFDPFFTTKPLGMGTGLGLSMIYGFVRQSGGQVRIYSEVGQGTTMCLYLPRHYGAAVDEARRGGSAEVLRAAEQGETVLVVDDEPTVRMLVTETLGDLGYTAIEAADGAAGLRVLRSDVRIDLLVTDVGLPGGMNGRQMADAARESRPDLKVLFITGYAENAVVGNGHLAPGMQVLTKPFVMEELASRIREMIEG